MFGFMTFQRTLNKFPKFHAWVLKFICLDFLTNVISATFFYMALLDLYQFQFIYSLFVKTFCGLLIPKFVAI